MWEFNYTDELYHHGVKGQRWGIRRYQNPDGTLTPAGKRRADKMKEEYTALTGKRLIKKPTPKTSTTEQDRLNTLRSKKITEMSDQEVKDLISRLDNEKRLASLKIDTESTGKKIVRKVADGAGSAALEAGRSLIKDAILKVGKKSLGLDDDAKSEAVEDIYKELRQEVEGLKLNSLKKTYEENISRIDRERVERQKAEEERAKKAEEKAKMDYYKKLYDEVDRELGEETVDKYKKLRLPYKK